jgi:alanyl-tRNA synthetase
LSFREVATYPFRKLGLSRLTFVSYRASIQTILSNQKVPIMTEETQKRTQARQDHKGEIEMLKARIEDLETRLKRHKKDWNAYQADLIDKACPNWRNHTQQPSDPREWIEWSTKMRKTHHQVMCPSCKLYQIWKPKEDREKRTQRTTGSKVLKSAASRTRIHSKGWSASSDAKAFRWTAVGDSSLHKFERLYYSDSFVRTFAGVVRDVCELAGSSGEPVWQLSLNCTAFYPTSGGQPFDTGQLNATLRDGTSLTVPVEQVEEDEEGTVWHFARRPLALGTHVEGQIDWERRFDHMQQHTGQHLLSAVFWRELQMPTVSFHLGETTSTIDLAGGPPAHHSLQRVERIANEIIAEDRQVTTRFVSRDQAQAMMTAGQLRKLPERQGTIRLIDIADCDNNACGGTHVSSTGQIGGLLVRAVEKVKQGVRVEFVCGSRAVRTARTDFAILSEVSALLSTGPKELAATVRKMLSDVKANAKEHQRLREELAVFYAAKLITEVPIENGLRLLVRAWKDRDRDYVKLLASRTAAAADRTAVIFSANDNDPVRIFVARSADMDFNCGQILREALANLGLRGGGSADLAQGEVSADQETALRASLSEAIYRAVADPGK